MAGIQADRFWRMTPAEVDLEVVAYLKEQERQDYRAALICSVLAEINRDPEKKSTPFSPWDFMPKPAEEEEKPIKRQSWEEILAAIEDMNADFRG